jgi:catechol 2,3-dioxygenase-like lactoylglutathione lyase family enzyme
MKISIAMGLAGLALFAQPVVKRPRILGVAHVAFFVSDLTKARAFYKDFLGFDEPFGLKRDDGTDRIAFIKINDQQYLELFAERPKDDGQLNHIALSTDNAEQMRAYLAAQGVATPPTATSSTPPASRTLADARGSEGSADKVGKGRTGNKNFTIKDPDGHTIEIVEYQPDSWTAREAGKFQPATRISGRLLHAGIIVRPLERAMKFYRDILGFQEFWRGSSAGGQTLSWVNMRVPDGQDYIEFMLYRDPPSAARRGTMSHVCLMVPDVEKAVAVLESRPARKAYARPIEIHTGVNRKRQVNLYDPDGTRIELMEPNTIDGKPAPPSTAPPPQ